MTLFHGMEQNLFPDEPDKITKLLKSIREASGEYIYILTEKQLSLRK